MVKREFFQKSLIKLCRSLWQKKEHSCLSCRNGTALPAEVKILLIDKCSSGMDITNTVIIRIT